MYRTLSTLALVAGLGSSAFSQRGAASEAPSVDPVACDASAIAWQLPGTFESTWQQAQDENRLLLIKGISFGVDPSGALCATRGKW